MSLSKCLSDLNENVTNMAFTNKHADQYSYIMVLPHYFSVEDKITTDVNSYISLYRTYLENVFRIACIKADELVCGASKTLTGNQVKRQESVLSLIKRILTVYLEKNDPVTLEIYFLLDDGKSHKRHRDPHLGFSYNARSSKKDLIHLDHLKL